MIYRMVRKDYYHDERQWVDHFQADNDESAVHIAKEVFDQEMIKIRCELFRVQGHDTKIWEKEQVPLRDYTPRAPRCDERIIHRGGYDIVRSA